MRIVEVSGPLGRKKFMDVSYRINRGSPQWVPPLKIMMRGALKPRGSILLAKGPYAMLVAEDDAGKIIGRILVGIDERLNREKNWKRGWFSLFDCVSDRTAAAALIRAAEKWVSERGMTELNGPVSPSGGDDFRGFLTRGFESQPSLMNSWNPSWIPSLFEEEMYCTETVLLAYDLKPEPKDVEHYAKVSAYARKKFGFRVDSAVKKQVGREIHDLAQVMKATVPMDWDMTVPSEEELKKGARLLMPILDMDFVKIARQESDGTPIGFIVAVPDFNQVLSTMNGSLFPFGFARFLAGRRSIRRLRVFIQFVVPQWQGRGVTAALYGGLLESAYAKGMKEAEGSTIGEENVRSRKAVEDFGAVISKVYKVYTKKLSEKP
jgi:GNAT superfamily N-acetyltransferase